MKVFLDDIRKPKDIYESDDWITVKTAWDAIKLLATNVVKEISLDHDLGDDVTNGTGYDVISWIEKQVFTKQKN